MGTFMTTGRHGWKRRGPWPQRMEGQAVDGKSRALTLTGSILEVALPGSKYRPLARSEVQNACNLSAFGVDVGCEYLA